MAAGSRSAGPVSEAHAPQATEVLTAEPAPRFFQADEARVCRFLVVRVLSVVPAAVGVHDASKSVFIRWRGGEAAGPTSLMCVPLPHAASMRASFAQALVAACADVCRRLINLAGLVDTRVRRRARTGTRPRRPLPAGGAVR